jgi:hypothetical protein
MVIIKSSQDSFSLLFFIHGLNSNESIHNKSVIFIDREINLLVLQIIHEFRFIYLSTSVIKEIYAKFKYLSKVLHILLLNRVSKLWEHVKQEFKFVLIWFLLAYDKY